MVGDPYDRVGPLFETRLASWIFFVRPERSWQIMRGFILRAGFSIFRRGYLADIFEVDKDFPSSGALRKKEEEFLGWRTVAPDGAVCSSRLHDRIRMEMHFCLRPLVEAVDRERIEYCCE